MPTLNITVRDKIATGDGQEIVCDNTDYLVHFDLDSEWDSYSAKTMRVLYLDGTYDDVIFTGDTATLPRIYEPNIYSYFTIGIGIYAGDLHSTVAAIFKCKESVLTGGSQHPDPPEDIYNQILDDINSGMLRGETGNGIESVALTSTVGNVDTYTITFTDGDTTTFNITNGAVTSVNGMTGNVSLDDVVAGYAKGIINQTPIEGDTSPYVFRSFERPNSDICAKSEKIVGGSVVWNQLVQNGDFSDGTTGWTARQTGGFSVVSGEGVLAVTGNNNNNTIYSGYTAISGHKYLVRAKLYIDASSSIKTARIGLSNNYTEDVVNAVNVTTTKTEYAAILTPAGTPNRLTINVRSSGSLTVGDKLYLDDVTAIDLTLMFGSAIADRAYTLEQATAGSGVAWLKSYGFFTKPYYAYTASPSLQSVKVFAHETIGYNQWDEVWEIGTINQTTGQNGSGSVTLRAKNYIPIFPNTAYYRVSPLTLKAFWYDGNKNFIGSGNIQNAFTTPTNARYMRFTLGSSTNPMTTYNNNVCVSLYGDGERAGEYEAYNKHSYPFDSSVELRGVYKLDSNNKIYADGDKYHNDGTIDGVFADVDMGSLTWTYDSTNGVFYSGSGASLNAKVNVQSAICSKYVFNGSANSSSLSTMASNLSNGEMCSFSNENNVGRFVVKDSAYTDATTFTTAVTGVKLIYELAEPTTETADPFQSPMIVDDWGTERFVDAEYEAGNRDFEMPVGHETNYFEAVSFENELPPVPSEDGVYTFKATVSNGVVTYSWVT